MLITQINNNDTNQAVQATNYYRKFKLLNIKVATVSDVIQKHIIYITLIILSLLSKSIKS